MCVVATEAQNTDTDFDTDLDVNISNFLTQAFILKNQFGIFS